MQSAIRDDLSPGGPMLIGSPVYSVYLPVGGRKEWLLEDCVPVRQDTRSNPYEVTIEDERNVAAPFPLATAAPNGLLAQMIPSQILLHGFINFAGALRDIKPLVSTPLLDPLLPLLSQWRFRPALRNNSPVEVEILLVIPATTHTSSASSLPGPP